VKPISEIAIGELSRRTQCHIETIRYYERIELLPQPRRTQARFRRYRSEDVARLRFIRRARQLGFSLEEVRALLRLSGADGDHNRVELRNLVVAHVAELRARIDDLLWMDRVLSAAICECASGQQPECPIMDVLSDAPAASPGTGEPITFCPACELCPELEITDQGVRIGEDKNNVRLSPAEWNKVVRLIKNGTLREV